MLKLVLILCCVVWCCVSDLWVGVGMFFDLCVVLEFEGV